MSPAARAARRIRVEGIVQGVGFRPFVHALAHRYALAGRVGNDSEGVFIEVEGGPDALAAFVDSLEEEAPPLAVITRVTSEPMTPVGATGFVIAESRSGTVRATLVAPDTATCEDCLRELFDPADRRYRFPFVNCTNCGPRFTIIRDLPYDRPATTMAGFTMCADCEREYHDPGDRRFHAQPVCCPACGPELRLVDQAGEPVEGDPIAAAAALLRSGAVVAVKGLGGYHLAALTTDSGAVAALRNRKHREDKPFAVMVCDLVAARELCEVDDDEARVLATLRRPVVLLRGRVGAPLAAAVAPGNRFVGLMLPYTPLHHLLARELGAPFVLTSGNVSDEPIAYHDDDATVRLAGIADYFLVHDRPIHVRTDDSVTRVFRGREVLVRRSRGHVPQPVPLHRPVPRPVLACGAELKNTFCLAKGNNAFVSHHIGDLENAETLRSFTEGIAHVSRLFDITPEVVAHDLHPEYLSTKYACDLAGVDLVGVQHHHAHIASCLADNGVDGPVIGIAFDGLGYGTDGTLWGGEFLRADLARSERLGHLDTVPLPGGAAAIREPWRMAVAWLAVAFDGEPPTDLAVVHRHGDQVAALLAMIDGGLNCPVTSSAGRLFDAVAAVLGVRDVVNYEGQAAVELEQLADPAETSGYPAAVTGEAPFRVRCADLVRAAVDDLRSGIAPARIAARFHHGVARAVVAGARQAADLTGLDTVALSGGVFQNQLLLAATVDGLDAAGLRVLTHHRVPSNDGGISLGQAVVAGAANWVSADARQRVADEGVDDPGAAELGA